MGVVFGLLTGVLAMMLPVLIVVIIVKSFKKKPVKKVGWLLVACFVGMMVTATVFSFFNPQNSCEHEFETSKEIAATCIDEGVLVQRCPKCYKEKEEVLQAKGHEWNTADCEHPKTCKICGDIDGEANGHTWITETCTTPKMCEICGAISAAATGHSWVESTCTAPKTCKACGETEGEVASHVWKAATCTTAESCENCGATNGNPLSVNKTHTWEAASCIAPKTCSVCGASEGTVADHIVGEWAVSDKGTSEAQGTKQQKCLVCDEVIKSQKFDPPAMVAKKIVESVVTQNAGSAEVDVMFGDTEESLIVTGEIYCKNDEKVVKAILSSIAEEMKKVDATTDCVFAFGNIDDKDNDVCLAMATIDSSGEYNIAPMSGDFKTERSEWIRGQFSAWDGSHRILTELIKDNLHDEKSYKHIETTYIDVANEKIKEEVNTIIKNAGFSRRVDVGDLLIITEFSAKNLFNATVKNSALGIVDYSEGNVILLGIE